VGFAGWAGAKKNRHGQGIVMNDATVAAGLKVQENPQCARQS
jgi:hypothetical protein